MSLVTLLAAILATATPMADRDIAAPGPQGPLKGSWTGPEGPRVPVVLMIPGSGPTDRDGNSPRGLKAASLRLLAEGLANRGIASVRIDKRGMFASAGAIPDANKVTIDDYAADTRAWIAAIRAKTGAPCVWVLGHSEGGLVALDTAAARPAGLCGVIAVSTPDDRWVRSCGHSSMRTPPTRPCCPMPTAQSMHWRPGGPSPPPA